MLVAGHDLRLPVTQTEDLAVMQEACHAFGGSDRADGTTIRGGHTADTAGMVEMGVGEQDKVHLPLADARVQRLHDINDPAIGPGVHSVFTSSSLFQSPSSR